MTKNNLLPKRTLCSVLFVLLLSVAGTTNALTQTPYRQYANDGIELNFFKIENVDFRTYLLYNLSQDNRFVLTAEADNGIFYIGSSDESLDEGFFDTFEDIYNLSYTDFHILSKLEITDLYPVWKSQVDPRFYTSMMMDITLRNSRNSRDGQNETCLNADPFCTSDFYEFESSTTTQTADDLEPYSIEDGCIGSSYNPSWYYLRIADPGPLTIHMEGHDPDNPSTQRDIDFCLWGPFTEEQMNSGYACTHLTSDRIIDCNYSPSYLENAFLGYPDGQHQHSSGHGTVNYHVPQSGEYYLLMITNFSRQPCVITFNKPDETEPGTTDCTLLPLVVENDGPYCIGETIHLYAPSISGATYSWTGPNNYRSRYQNPNRSNCTMDMAGIYTCTITKNGQSFSATTEVIIYDEVLYTEISISVCNGSAYTWHGNTYTESGDYVDITETSQGCRNIETLHLTINEAEIEEFTASAYDSYTWHDQTYTESGTYTFETQTPEGCMRIEILHLTIGNHWTPVSDGQYAYSMTLWGVIQINGIEQSSDRMELGVFCGEECRGSALANEFFLTHRYLINMNIYGESGDQLNFRLFDHITQQEMNLISPAAIAFTLDGYGTPIEPYVLNFISYMDITATIEPEGAGTVTGMGEYVTGTTCTLTAMANTGYQFQNWTLNGTVVSTSPNYTFTVTESANYVAHFQLQHFTINASADTSDGGTVSGVGIYNYGQTCILTAMANEGYQFQNWTLNGTVVSTIPSYMFTVTESANYVAHFQLQHFTINASADPSDGGTVGGVGTYNYGQTCTLTAAPATGYVFINWTKNGAQVSTSTSYSFTVTEAANYVAHFQHIHIRTLATGWNWWSTYIEQEGTDGLSMLENSLGTSGIRIQGKNKSIDYFEYQGIGYWYGSLNTIANEQMYMIHTSAACNAILVGDAALPMNHPITINSGWNWIGFPSCQPMDINEAMSGFTPEANDFIKGRSSASTYISYNGYEGWYGQLNSLEPGMGYMYKSNSGVQKTLTFQTGRGNATPNITPDGNVFIPITENYANSMVMTVVIEIDGKELRSTDYEIATFVGNECRGSVKLIYVEPFDRYVAILMAFGEGDEELRFVLTDGNGTSWSNDRLTYVANCTVGTVTEPAVLHFGPLSIEDNIQKPVNVYPNPSNGIFNIEGEGIRKIEVIDVYGQVILSKEINNANIQVDLRNKATGAYLLRVMTDSGIMTNKIIKK